MERLVTTAQAAQILGLSLQGVHYRIKNNQLKSIKKSGKTYVYVDEHNQNFSSQEEPNLEVKNGIKSPYSELIEAKNEQIDILKKSIKWMKNQYSSEIHRLEKNQKRIIAVFNREIELLQSAFNEMRSIYKQPQLQTIQKDEEINEASTEEKERFISLQNFTLYLKRHNKSEKDIKLIILKAIQKRDPRFIYNRKDKKLLILNEDFSDLI